MSADLLAVAASLRTYESRMSHTVERLAPFHDEHSYGMDRALVAAGRLFAVDKHYVRRLAANAFNQSRRSVVSDTQLWLHQERKRRVEEACVDVLPLCGWVYRARLVEFPHIFKIGISQQPDRRMKQLSSEARTAVELEECEASTYFEEAFRLLVFGRFHIRGEWFFDPSLNIDAMPPFLAGGWDIDRWRRAASKNRSDVEAGRNPLGALGNVYLEAFTNAGAA